MTQFEIITLIAAAAGVWSVAIAAHAWRIVKLRQSDNWIAVNREAFSAQRNIIRDTRQTEQER